MSNGLGPLSDGGRVVIIGGGPGGAGAALALHRLAQQLRRRIHITVVESKVFQGEQHYNQCAGVLSPPLPELLEGLGVPFPHHLTRGLITGYVLHANGHSLTLNDSHHAPSIALRRVQFDAYLLQQVQARGIQVHNARVVDLEFHADRVVLYTDNAPLEADVVVGAFGLDEGTGALFRRQVGYRPPKALSSVVTKYHPGDEGMAAFGSQYIHAFLPAHPRIEFGAVTPKGNHLTINIAGEEVDATLMARFLHDPEVRAVLPNVDRPREPLHDLRFFKGRFPRSLAHRYYGERYVMVGDAAGLVRAFKGKGVTSAVQTGIRAAEVILRHGISHAAFERHYRAANRDITHDLPYGQFVRLLTIHAARWGLMKPVVRAADSRPELQSALFGAVSGYDPYANVLRRVLRPTALMAILRALVF